MKKKKKQLENQKVEEEKVEKKSEGQFIEDNEEQ